MKKGISVLLALVLLFGMTLTLQAASNGNTSYALDEIITISGPDDIIVVNEDGIWVFSPGEDVPELTIPTTDGPTSRIQRSYWKVHTMQCVMESKNPSFWDFPQTIWYSEVNPYVPGNAMGTLSLYGIQRVGSVGSAWLCQYEGYLYYYVD